LHDRGRPAKSRRWNARLKKPTASSRTIKSATIGNVQKINIYRAAQIWYLGVQLLKNVPRVASRAFAAAAADRSEIFGMHKATHIGPQDADAKNSKAPSTAVGECASIGARPAGCECVCAADVCLCLRGSGHRQRNGTENRIERARAAHPNYATVVRKSLIILRSFANVWRCKTTVFDRFLKFFLF